MVVSWPKRHQGRQRRRARSSTTSTTSRRRSYEADRHHRSPRWWTASSRSRWTASSFAYTLRRRRSAEARHTSQYFDIIGSRGIYQDGWCGLRLRPAAAPWAVTRRSLRDSASWDSGKDVWELYDLHQATSRRPTTSPRRNRSGSTQMKRTVPDARRRRTRSSRIGAGIWLRLHPEGPHQDALHELAVRRAPRPACPSSPRRAWAARATRVTIDAEIGENASGVLYALGGAGGGLTLYMDKGDLVYEYNMMIIERYHRALGGKARRRQAPDRGDDDAASAKPLSPAEVVLQGRRAGSRRARR
ncbi:MAG: hypothetical protein MZV70_40045 [Desulfobacterales bacterium]|nr:hypothetical protein [Desulfobacterales bacterium]